MAKPTAKKEKKPLSRKLRELAAKLLPQRPYLSEEATSLIHGRTGSCHWEKCEAACCRIAVFRAPKDDEHVRYLENFGFRSAQVGGGRRVLILDRPCRHLDLKTNKCRMHSARPVPCRQFPMPTDALFALVRDRCGYDFPAETKKKFGLM